jgi:hypothetical protein
VAPDGTPAGTGRLEPAPAVSCRPAIAGPSTRTASLQPRSDLTLRGCPDDVNPRPGVSTGVLVATIRAVHTEPITRPGWCRNLIEAAHVRPGDAVLVVVDEPLVAEDAQLADAVPSAGAEVRLDLWAADERPMRHAPPRVLEVAHAPSVDLISSLPELEADGEPVELP